MARDAAELQKWEKHLVAGIPFLPPKGFLELLSAATASERIGARVTRGGLWHTRGGLVNAGPWARFQLETSGALVISNQKVDRLEQHGALWRALGENGTVLAEAPFAIVAAASDSARLLNSPLSVKNWRGRVSLLSKDDLAFLKGGITGKGYAIRSEDGWVCAGASYEEDGEESLEAEQVHRANLDKLRGFFPDLSQAWAEGFFDGMRAVSADRLPLVGSVPLRNGDAAKGLYCAYGFASRAITLCDLSARIIAAHIEGEPLPIESDLARAISPWRFLIGP
jgi:tRNA 5-methylaminomethyl-2-thiouridine biosynthesis bifunctional protein